MPISASRSGRALPLLLTLSLGFITLGFLVYVIGLMWMPNSPIVSENSLGYDRDVAEEFPGKGGGVVSPSDGRDEMGEDAPDKGGDDQFVIKTAAIQMTVNDLDDSSDNLRKYAKEVGGYVENLYDSGEDASRTVQATIRVPAAAFDSVVSKLKDMGVDVVASDENADDITETYKDLEARLKNQKALEAQLLKILDIAEEVEDILAVQRELSSVREQIETMQTTLDYYDSRVEMASVTVYMSQSAETLDVNSDPWRPVGVFREAIATLIYIVKSLGSLLIWAIVLSPLVLVPMWLYKAFWSGKKK
jgi:hypothetical protein